MTENIIFASGNTEKFYIAQSACRPYDITLVQQPSGVDEIQAEDPETVIRDKVKRVFEELNQPVIVSDDSWAIPALQGFPGPYMKSINQWLSMQDWLNLMKPYEDRSVILIQLLAYYDGTAVSVFQSELNGTFLREPHGNYGSPFQKVVTMSGDHGLSIAEVYDKGPQHDKREVTGCWNKFLNWYTAEIKQPA